MKNSIIKIVFIALAICLAGLSSAAFGQQTRGAGNVRVKDEAGNFEDVKLYEGSFALVIGVSDYTNGWKDLSGVKTDVAAVKTALETQGFTVKIVLDPTSEQLQAALNNFVRDYGYTFGNRLLVYYAGHGDTQIAADGRKLGYIVPADASLPSKNLGGFQQTAISMNDFEYYAQRIQAKHALFVFDSCFSGTMLTTTRSNVPPIINFKTTQPVRQFITAGADDQEVPDISEFRKQFVEGLGGEADLNADGYITGSEFADFLQTKVSNYTREAQTPQYGKIRDGRLDKGDFVFTVPRKDIVPPPPVPPPPVVTVAKIDVLAIEKEFWESIKTSTNVEDFKLYKNKYPSGVYSNSADLNISRLTRTNNVSSSAASPSEATYAAAIGIWDMKIVFQGQESVQESFKVTHDGKSFSGEFSFTAGKGILEDGKLKGNIFTGTIKLLMKDQVIYLQMESKIEGNKMTGNLLAPGIPVITFTASKK